MESIGKVPSHALSVCFSKHDCLWTKHCFVTWESDRGVQACHWGWHASGVHPERWRRVWQGQGEATSSWPWMGNVFPPQFIAQWEKCPNVLIPGRGGQDPWGLGVGVLSCALELEACDKSTQYHCLRDATSRTAVKTDHRGTLGHANTCDSGTLEGSRFP